MATVETKERPILFSDAMVRAILAGTKTQTRRVIKPQPDNPGTFGISPIWGQGVPRNEDRFCIHAAFNESGRRVDKWLPCPYGAAGDRLWVRECWAPIPQARPSGYFSNPELIGKDYWYRASDCLPTWGGKWKPSIHMPRWASRLLLEVKSIRVERVQEMGYKDWVADFAPNSMEREKALATFTGYDFQREHSQKLWDSINGTRVGCAWADNPWIWVVEFEQVQERA